ncbi:MAG: ABC transporter substrate-binding protein [Thermofilum sp.]
MTRGISMRTKLAMRKAGLVLILGLILAGPNVGLTSVTLVVGKSFGISGRESLVMIVGSLGEEEERAAELVLETLTRIGEDGNPYSCLAESWFSHDGLTWTFHLRKGILFHDGSPLTATDVAYSLGPYVVHVLDKYKFEIHLDKPNPFLPVALSVLPILPANFAKFEDEHVQITQLVGTGPYRPVEWIPDERVVLRRFDGYWGEPPPFENVVFLRVPEPTLQMEMVATGAADLILDAEGRQLAYAKYFPMLRTYTVPTDEPYALLFNLRTGIFSDFRVRRALAYAIGWDAINLILEQLFEVCGAPCAGPIAPVYLSYCPLPIERDLARASSLLQEAGWRQNRYGIWEMDGHTLAFIIITTPGIPADIARVIQAFWRSSARSLR